jgi:hypothetical protein
MKQLLLVLLFLNYSVGFVSFAESPTDEDRAKLLSPVQTVTSVTTVASRESERVVSHYDVQGNEIKTLRYVDTDTLVEKSVHTYNASGKKTETTVYKPDGSLLTKTLYLYDFQGRLSEQTTLDDVGLIDRAMYIYEAKKQAVEETITSARQGATRRLIHFYDSKGQETVTLLVAREGSVNKTLHTYDDKGNEAARAVSASDGAVLDRLRYDYEFDTTGNWIKQTELICLPTEEAGAAACTPAAVTVRIIIYTEAHFP